MDDQCRECGMFPEDPLNHPFLACLAFKWCRNGKAVDDNLRFVQEVAAKKALASRAAENGGEDE